MHAGIDYGKLGAEVGEWRKGYLEGIREFCGEGAAEVSARDLDADPWQALEWFLADRRYALREDNDNMTAVAAQASAHTLAALQA